MTGDVLWCEWCGEPFERPGDRGPVPRFCKRSHRQRAYESRRYGGPATLAEVRARG